MKSEKKKPLSPIEALLGGKKEPEKPWVGKPVKHKRTTIDSHTNGSHTVKHSPDTPEEVSYAAPDMDSLMGGLKENLGAGQGSLINIGGDKK